MIIKIINLISFSFILGQPNELTDQENNSAIVLTLHPTISAIVGKPRFLVLSFFALVP